MDTTKSYQSTGLVYGCLWGGGEGGYPARQLEGNSLQEIIDQANAGLDGSLDSGMGFERLLGAFLLVTETSTIEVDGKSYSHKETLEPVFIGELTDMQKQQLEDWYYDN